MLGILANVLVSVTKIVTWANTLKIEHASKVLLMI